eukprot:411632-Pyramimonas_sp.AAC.1
MNGTAGLVGTALQEFTSNRINEALMEDEEYIKAGLQAYPKQVDAKSQPLRYRQKFKHLGKKTASTASSGHSPPEI